MKILLLCIGKTNEKYLDEGIQIYLKRLKHYTSFSLEIIKDVKSMKDKGQFMQSEFEAFQKHLTKEDYIVLLDENGKEKTSKQLASFIEQKQVQSMKRLVFVIGGAYGFDPAFKKMADETLSLSKMTFSHQMIRLFFVEQIYRAFTIIRNEKYHNP